jgi:Ca-activated chloride channel family protein
MSFDTPQFFIGFVLYLPLIILEIVHHYRRRLFLKDFISATCFSGDPLYRQGLLRNFRHRALGVFLLRGIFLACLIIALAGPRWGKRMVMEYRRGVDVVFALDLSRSMEVRDIPAVPPEGPSRLDRALSIARETAGAIGEIRLGAAIGKGRGVLAVPLTYDTGALVSFLEGLSGSAITGQGTNLEILIDAAAGAFQDGFPTSREIILFSDGETLSGSLFMASDRVLEREVRISAVGLGTEQGGPVPYELPLAQEQALEEAPVSYRRSDTLQRIAERTGGVYIDGNRDDVVNLLLDHIRTYGLESGMQGYHLEAQARWRVFVIAALISLGLIKVLNLRRRNHR